MRVDDTKNIQKLLSVEIRAGKGQETTASVMGKEEKIAVGFGAQQNYVKANVHVSKRLAVVAGAKNNQGFYTDAANSPRPTVKFPILDPSNNVIGEGEIPDQSNPVVNRSSESYSFYGALSRRVRHPQYHFNGRA